ncbi:ferredoxin [Methanosarcinales archaeon]|nr:MAG: ferredoxin [Methanosarcinales archaeon]
MKCVGCGECVSVCPVDAIEVCVVAKIGDKCIGCGRCVMYCPVDAIYVEGGD